MFTRRFLALHAAFLFLWIARPAIAEQSCGGQVCVQTQEEAGGVRFTALNNGYGSVTMQVKAALVNLKADVALPYTTVLKPGTTPLFYLRILKKQDRYRYNYEFRYQFGNANAKPDGTVYALPFAEGERYPILQGYNSSFSHNGSLAWSIDWDVPEGTPVHAARGGMVIGTEDRNTIGAPDRALFTKANYVLIEHSDGTVGEYYHLKPGGTAVKAGQRVAQGALIGYSGNTGFSTQPHLHFHVSRPTGGTETETLRIYYVTEGSHAQTLLYGKTYRTVKPLSAPDPYLPGGRSPEILLCASLEDGFPVDQKETFFTGEQIVVHFSFASGPPQRFKVVFRRNGVDVYENNVTTEPNWDYAFITLDTDRTPEPEGDWEAVTYVNDQQASVLRFDVRSKAAPDLNDQP